MQRMGWTLPFTIGNLHLLWYWALDYAPTGDLTKFDPHQLTQNLRLGNATPAEFLDAMIQAGFIDRIGYTLIIHDWVDYKRPKPRQSLARSSSPSYRPAMAGRDPSVRRMSVPDSVDDTTQSAATPDAATHHGDAPPDSDTPEQEPANTKREPAPLVEIPPVLDALPSFTDLWWPRFLDLYKTNGDPLSAYEQSELLARLATQPFSAIEKLKTSIRNFPNESPISEEELLQNTS